MKKILLLLLLVPLSLTAQTINISLDYAGLIVEPVQGQTTPVTALEIGDEFYIDVTISNSDNSQFTATFADIWLTFKNDAFEYLGVDNPNGSQANWYTNQWPSVYTFNTATQFPVDDMYLQYYNSSWSYVGEESFHAPLVITSQTAVELTGVVARLKFKYKPVPNGFDFSQSVMLRKARVRDNINGYDFSDTKAFPNQTFDNVPVSTTVTALLHVDFPETVDPTMFNVGLYKRNAQDPNTWEQVPGSSIVNFDSAGDANITPGFNRTDDLAAIINWNSQTPFSEFYDEVVTISDAALAFKELNNRGINQDEIGNEFGYGIQFMNGDVYQNGDFHIDDSYKILAHVLGNNTYLEQTDAMVYASKFYLKSDYDAITIANYLEYPNSGTLMILLDNTTPNVLNFEYDASIAWRGDVNLSHSSLPVVQNQNVAKTAKAFRFSTNKEASTIYSKLTTELKDGKVVATLTFDPKAQDVTGTQFKLAYDESKLTFDEIKFNTANSATNFGTAKGNYVRFGSLIQVGTEKLTDKTTYTLTFTPKVELNNTLGLIVTSNTDAVNKSGEQLKLIIN
jgi:hypothetical protein